MKGMPKVTRPQMRHGRYCKIRRTGAKMPAGNKVQAPALVGPAVEAAADAQKYTATSNFGRSRQRQPDSCCPDSSTSVDPEMFDEVLERLIRIEAALQQIVAQKTVKEFYTTAEVAETTGRAEFTVREWCRNGRVLAEKRQVGRGVSKEWMISHDELMRVQNEGLLPL